MTLRQAIEQKVSWIYGQNALSSPSHLSKQEGVVYKKAFEEALVDLRVAVGALRALQRLGGSVIAEEALAAIKTRGL